jgi:CubicO group peptidase (beta-lactamase class C family)
MAAGLHVGAQLYVSLRGESLADVAMGEARAGVPMRSDTVMLWLSSGKPLAAVAVAQLWERGLLELDDPVAKHLPEFSVGGKEVVTVRHILTHTAGFRAVLGKWEDKPHREVIAAVMAARIEPRWTPGVTAGYHPLTSWYVLGELVHRLDGRPYERYVREAIALPAGMPDTWCGMPPETYRAYGNRIGLMHHTQPGRSPDANFFLDTEHGASQCRPPSGARGPARDLGRFYEMLWRRGRGVASDLLLSSQTVEAITAHHRVGVYDKTFKHVVDWGLGFVLQSNQYGAETVPYNYGPHASPRTFGHSGSRSSVGFCDPEHGLCVACIFNGAPTEQQHDARMRAVTTAIYEELGLVQASELTA